MMRTRRDLAVHLLRLLAAAAVLIPAWAAPPAPVARYDIKGKIHRLGPGRQATVEAVRIGSGETYSAMNNLEGAYAVRALLPGQYRVRATHPLYRIRPPVRTVTVRDRDVTNVDFTAHLLGKR